MGLRRDVVVRACVGVDDAVLDARVHAVRGDDARSSTPKCVVLDVSRGGRAAQDDAEDAARRAVRARDVAMQRVMGVAAAHGVGCEDIVRTTASEGERQTTCAPVVATRRATIGKRRDARAAAKSAHADFIRDFRAVCGGEFEESGEMETVEPKM